MHFIFDAELMW